MYYPLYLKVKERNRTAAYHRERLRRKTITEGTFASLDRLGWVRSRLRGGLWKVECEGYMAALAHNVLKMVRKLGRGVGPPGPVSPVDAVALSAEHAMYDAVADSFGPPWCFAWISWLVLYARPALR